MEGFTEKELNTLIQLLDRVTTKGIQEAVILVQLVNKIETILGELNKE